MHCSSHQLNLNVANTFKMTSVHNLMGNIREITVFQLITGKGASFTGCVHLKCLVSTIPGLEIFVEFYEALVNTFEDIYHNKEEKFNWDSMKEAFCFLSLITLTCIMAMVVFIIAITLLSTILFQKSRRRMTLNLKKYTCHNISNRKYDSLPSL